MGGLLEGKKVLVTGVLDRRSIAYSAARLAQEQGAQIVLSGFGRARSLTERTARRLDPEPPILELDVNKPEDIEAVADDLERTLGELDGSSTPSPSPPRTPWGQLPHRTVALRRHGPPDLGLLLEGALRRPRRSPGTGASVVGLDFDARIAWPAYDWMGVAKAALESTSRYLARDLGQRGIRVNLVSAGPVKTLAAKASAASRRSKASGPVRRPSAGTPPTPSPSDGPW